MSGMTELQKTMREVTECCTRIREMAARERDAAFHDQPLSSEAGKRLLAEAEQLDRLARVAAALADGDSGNPLRAELRSIVKETMGIIESSLFGLREAQKAVLADLRGLGRSREAIQAYKAGR